MIPKSISESSQNSFLEGRSLMGRRSKSETLDYELPDAPPKVEVTCLKCQKKWLSTSKFLRMCKHCKLRNAEVFSKTPTLRVDQPAGGIGGSD